MSVGLVIGGWFASAAVGKLADALRSYVVSQHEYQTAGIKGKLKSLEENMTNIVAVTGAADGRHIEDHPELKKWLRELKDACYDAEDVIDMFEYELLKDKANPKNQVSRSYRSARVIVKRSLFGDNKLNQLLEIVDIFEKLVRDMGGFPQLLSLVSARHVKVDEIMKERETTSSPPDSKMFGRDEERIRLKELLLKENDGGSVHYVSIVGSGGVGKTSLGRDVYNDPHLTTHFDLKAWVCVSNNFDVKRIVREIIESAFKDKIAEIQNLNNLDRVAEILRTGLRGKRFLIFLDDIWDEPSQNWEEFSSILNSGKKGSRVFITTRNPKIADILKAESVALEGLQGEEYWNLFVDCAFGGKSPREYPALESLGKEIVKKLKGNPLAARVLGAVLNRNLEADHWREILESKLCEIEDFYSKIIPVLRLSYDYLPAHLKPCFVYSCLFPEDYRYSEDEIIQLWIAQGFVQPLKSKSMEKVGKDYFRDLVSRGFFQKTSYLYVMHDLLHDLGESLFDRDLLREMDYLEDRSLPEKFRHAYIHADYFTKLCNNEYAKKHLRSLVVYGRCDRSLDILNDLRGVRVLILENWYWKFSFSSKSLGQMLHLRYLALNQANSSHSDSEPKCCIPEAVTKLYHLQVLRVDSKKRFFPKGANKLISLRHLIPCTNDIAGMRRTTSLQELEVDASKRGPGYELEQLRDMLQLTQLSIDGLDSVRGKEEASKLELYKKGNLERLELRWRWRHGTIHDEVIEGLKPHQNLKELKIWFHPGGRCPSWLDGNWLSNLSSVELHSCENWDALPPLGRLPFLRHLHLQGMTVVREIGLEFYGGGSSTGVAFPSLESLTLDGMPELTKWHINVDGLRLFPRLSRLEVHECPNLRGPLYVPSPLTSLSVEISSYMSYSYTEARLDLNCITVSRAQELIPCQALASVTDMRIEYSAVEELSARPEEDDYTVLGDWFQHMTSLETLLFHNCEYLYSIPSLPRNGILRKVSVHSYSNLKRPPEERLPSSLLELEIRGCPLLEERCKRNGPDWHKVAHIPKITIDGRVIQML